MRWPRLRSAALLNGAPWRFLVASLHALEGAVTVVRCSPLGQKCPWSIQEWNCVDNLLHLLSFKWDVERWELKQLVATVVGCEEGNEEIFEV